MLTHIVKVNKVEKAVKAAACSPVQRELTHGELNSSATSMLHADVGSRGAQVRPHGVNG